MIKITVNQSVLDALKLAFPKANSAQKALDKYVKRLEDLLFDALALGQTEYELKLNFYSIKVNDLRHGGGRIGAKKTWVHDWLEDNKLSLIKIIEKGSNLNGLKSVIALTDLVSVTDTLIEKPTLDVDFKSGQEFMNYLYQGLDQLNEAEVLKQYDIQHINTQSLKSYIEWLDNKASKFSVKKKQHYLRQANQILKIAEFTEGIYLQKKIKSEFGRTYYEGTSVQNVNKELRRAMLGDCWEYDIKSSVIAWKMGFARECYASMSATKPFEKVFFETLLYLQDRRDFMLTARSETFTRESNSDREAQEKIIKSAVTAITFGATVRSHGWKDASGQWQYASINSIIKNTDERKRFTKSGCIKGFIKEQKLLDDFIFKKLKSEKPHLLTKTELLAASGALSKSKFLAHEYQHAETEVMDVVRDQLDQLGKGVLANIHDAIIISEKLKVKERHDIEEQMRLATSNEYWVLVEKQLEGYKSVDKEVIKDELEHKQRMAQFEREAQGYKSALIKT